MKKFSTLLLTTFFPLGAFCSVGENFTVNVDGLDMNFKVLTEGVTNTAMTTSRCIDWDYNGDVTVPSSVTYNGRNYTVTEIGSSSFSSCKMKTISLPSTLTAIRRYGISYCYYLNSIHIPASVSLIEEAALCQNGISSLTIDAANSNYVIENKALYNKDKTLILQYTNKAPDTSFSIPSTVTRIASFAFDDCDNLVSVTIPPSVVEIGTWAFFQCSNLASIYIPASVIKIEEGAFTGFNYAMTSLEVDPANPAYTSVDGVIYTKDMSSIIAYPVANSQNSYTIFDGTTVIYGGSFDEAVNLYSVFIPNSVVEIGGSAFFGCSGLKSVDIPESVQRIGSQAFDYCSNLTEVYMHSLVPPYCSWYIFGGNENLTVYVPYQSIAAYRDTQYLTRAHMDPAIDWHDNHWYWVFTCIEGIDFSQDEDDLQAFIVTLGSDSNAPQNISARKANDGGAVSLSLVPVEKAGPGDCVLLKVSEPGKMFKLHSDETAPNVTGNLLVGVTEEASVSGVTGGMVNYAFDGEGFSQIVGSDGIMAGSGYLQLPEEIASQIGNSISVSDITTTAVSAVRNSKVSQDVYYSLSGQRVENPSNGIYIKNGKKVMVRY